MFKGIDLIVFISAGSNPLFFHLSMTANIYLGASCFTSIFSVVFQSDLILFSFSHSLFEISGLGLQKVGVKLGERGEILVNKSNQTNIKSIYAIGDVTDKITLTPIAIAEGHAFADREFGGIDRYISYDNVPSAVFSQPSIAVVGLNYEQAKKNNMNVREYKSEFRALKNTITGNPERTLMKLVVDQDTQKVIGAHMIGPDAAEIIQGVAVAIKAGALKSDFDSTIGIHPSAAEEFVTMRS